MARPTASCHGPSRRRQDRRSALVAKTCLVADPRHAGRAQGVQISLVQRVVGTAVLAGMRALGPRRAAGRATYDVGVVRSEARHLDRLAARAMEPATGRESGGVVLPPAGRTGHQTAHPVFCDRRHDSPSPANMGTGHRRRKRQLPRSFSRRSARPKARTATAAVSSP